MFLSLTLALLDKNSGIFVGQTMLRKTQTAVICSAEKWRSYIET